MIKRDTRGTEDLRESKRRQLREMNKRLSYERRLNSVFDLSNFCFMLREAAIGSESTKGVQRVSKRP